MNIDDLISVAFVLIVFQLIAYFSARSVLGKGVGRTTNNLLGFACMTSMWGSFYVGLFLQSVSGGLCFFLLVVAGVVYGLRRRSNNSISIKQALLIYGGIALRLFVVAMTVGAIARVCIMMIKKIAESA
jgi:hypothetical protein